MTGPPPVESLEQRERDIAVANPADETRESFDAHIERVEELALGAREQSFPERESRAEPAHLPVQPVQTARRGVGRRDDLVDRPGHLVEDSGDLARDALGSHGALARRLHHRSLSRGAGRVSHVNHSEEAAASLDSTPVLLEPRVSRKACTGPGSRTSRERAPRTEPFPRSE